jgi:hypothetical protein
MKRLVPLTIACLVVGLVAMFGFEYPLTRIIGVLALFAFIVGGVFAIADPVFLDEDDG